MKASEIRVGRRYRAKVNGQVVPVRVDAIEETYRGRRNGADVYLPSYRVTNLRTNRRTTFRSPQKFREEIVDRAPATSGAAVREAMDGQPQQQ